MNHPSPLEIRDKGLNDFYEDDIVSFVAKKETNRNDPTKFFWFATNIRVKE